MVMLSANEITKRTSAELAPYFGHTWAEVRPKLPSKRYDAVVVLLGYNDIIRGRISQADIENTLRQLKKQSPCVVALVPGHMATAKMQADWRTHRTALQHAGSRQGVKILPDLSNAWTPANIDQFATSDKIHPTSIGQRSIAIAIQRARTHCPK